MRVFLDVEILSERDRPRETPVSADYEQAFREIALEGDWVRALTIGLIIRA